MRRVVQRRPQTIRFIRSILCKQSVALSGLTTTGGYDIYTLVNALETALGGMDVVLDDVKVGKFVRKTVTDAIYQ